MGEAVASSPKKRRRKTKYIDYTLLLMIICLLAFGLVMLYSTSAYNATLKTGDAAFYLKKQIRAAAVGFVLMAICVKWDYHFFRRFAVLGYAVALVLCVAVNFVGRSTNGSSRWLYIGPLSFQPSELAKVAVILFLATIISSRPNAMKDPINIFKVLGAIAPIFIVVAYNNLSTAIIIMGIAIVMLFISNPKYFPFIIIGMVGILGGLVFIFGAKASYRMERIQIWFHPENYEKGYQTLQGLYAIGSGGLFGKGLGQSIQKLGFVPEAQNDMIFSIICEELGLFGAVCVILMFILLLWRFVIIATKAKDMFGSFLLIGIMTHIALQVILNIAVVTNTIPNTGITLPFVSYGGTSIMILLAEMGVALSVSKDMQIDI